MSSSPYAEAWLAGPENTQFYTRTYTPSSPAKAALVFIHGFAEHIGRYTDAHPQLAARGVAVFTFDQRGFGRTALDKEHASPSSAYGRTSGARQMADIEWALAHTAQAFPGLPLFLAGHSMGGGEVLLFATRGLASNLKGVIACSPCILQTKPASKVQRWIGGKAAILTPYLAIPAPLNFADLSHDAEYNERARTDPLAKLQGTLRGLSDMLDGGEKLLWEHYKSWPKALPVLFVHGSGDQITSFASTQEFHDKIAADDKRIIEYPGGFHELVQEPEHKDKLIDNMLAFIEARVGGVAAAPTTTTESKL